MFTSVICAGKLTLLSSKNLFTLSVEWATACHLMKLLRTLRARFAFWITILILTFIITFGGFIYFNLNRSLYDAVDDALSLSAEQVSAQMSIENSRLQIPVSDVPDPYKAFTRRGMTIIVLSQNGDVLQAVGCTPPEHNSKK